MSRVDADDPTYLVKGTVFRANAQVLAESGWLAATQAGLPADVAALLDQLPLAGTWLPGRMCEQVAEVVSTLHGLEAVRHLAREVVRVLFPFYMPMLQGIMRVLGASPARLFARYEDLARLHIKGMRFEYQATSPRSGVVDAHFLVHRQRIESAFVTVGCSLEAVYQVCGISGQVADPEIVSPDHGRYLVSW